MTRKDKMLIIEKIKKMTTNEIKKLQGFLNTDWIYEEKHRITIYIHSSKFPRHSKQSGYYLNAILGLPIQNDAPRGGMDGDFILIKENKHNIERVNFAKEFLSIY